jgi:large subunit ribosomal protein L23
MNKERIFKIIQGAQVSEKASNILSSNQYVFKVCTDATKKEISDAVQTLFDVSVLKVNTSVVKGKRKAFGRKLGKRKDWKKAFVRIQEGQTITELTGENA